MHKIPMLDLSAESATVGEQILDAIRGVIASGHFIMGPNVQQFEEEAARYLGVKHAVAVNSGTDALVIGLRAAGIGEGDEVITTPFTFFATAESISAVGAVPVFVDIDTVTFNLDVQQVQAAITPRTKAILPVHLYGHAVEMERLLQLAAAYRLQVIEDVAQGFGGEYRGQKLGTIGDVGCFSFFPSKNLGAYGDGGLLTTNCDEVAEQARMMRSHGSKRKYYNEMIGYNSRLDEMQAAILRVKLPHIDAWNAARRQVARQYQELLTGMQQIVTPHCEPHVQHVFHQYTVRVLNGQRDDVQRRLADLGIGTMIYYPVPVHRLPVYAELGCSLPVAERAAEEALSLPIWPQMDLATQERVVTALQIALR